MKKTALYVQNEASKKYNPYTLKDFLTRASDGSVIVDRSRLLKNKDDERLFYVVLNKDYGWDYRYPETTTIYFKEIDGKVYGGVYEPSIGYRSNRIIAAERNLAKEYDYNLYSYEADALAEIIKKINF
jgi:hypothetical protein